MEAERQASRARRTSCGATTDPELARILTFIAASEASHVPALRQLIET
jgi:rubrerythrin